MKLVLIEWMDIRTWAGWNEDLIEAGEDKPLEVTTVGYLVRTTKDAVTISDSYPDIGNVTVFPRGCIRSMRVLESHKTSKKKEPKYVHALAAVSGPSGGCTS